MDKKAQFGHFCFIIAAEHIHDFITDRVLFDLISILQALLPRKTCNEIVSTKAQVISSREELGKQFKIKEGRGHLHKRSMKSIAEEVGKVKKCCEFKSKQNQHKHTCFDVVSPGLLQTSTGHNFR